MKKLSIIAILLIFNLFAFSQIENDDLQNPKKEQAKTGFSFGAVAAIAYDSDIGFKYGGLVNIYDYGDGSIYPNYKHSLYLEWSRTTKGSGIANIAYDSKYLIPKVRVTFDLNYLTEQALDFYGFNGYEAEYKHGYEVQDSSNYRSRMYYRHERKMLCFLGDFQKEIIGRKLQVVAGFGYYGIDINSVDINKLNKGKSDKDKLPSVDSVPGLYEKYVDWGVIPESQKNGGKTTTLKVGVVVDTRDNEPNPMSGIWSEALIQYAPKFLGGESNYSQLILSHRQYFTLKKDVLNFAYRLTYQAKLSGDIPYYMLPFAYYSNKATRDGIGGSKTVRGVLRNRIVGDGMAYGNLELRWKFWRTTIKKQNFYVALSGFCDGGMVTQKYSFNKTNIPTDELKTFDAGKEGLHLSYGAGLHFVLNQNFIIAVDYGMASKKDDGISGLYINLGFLY